MTRWVAPVALLLVAAVCAWQGLVRSAGPSTSYRVGAPGPATPVLSARRVPIGLGEMIAAQRLGLRLATVLADPSIGADQLCLDVSVGGTVVFSRDAPAALIPASNLKLLTADAALRKLGPDARLTTNVVAAQPARGGVVNGPLWLVGGGDPLLATAGYRASQKAWTESVEPATSLESLADEVKAAGVTRVTGGVVGDDSRYDSQRTLPTWKASYLATGEIGPVGALVVDGGFLVSGTRLQPAADPAKAAAATFAALLQARGVTVDGPPSVGSAPRGTATVASIASVPLAEVVGEMLRESDNLAAEMLTKELGARFGGAGSWAAGIGVIHEALVDAGLPLAGYVQVDGSGLDRGDRVSCTTLAALNSSTDPSAQLVSASLPTAGDCGTLVKRLTGPMTSGRVRAKTGSLTGVAAFTGYLAAAVAGPLPHCPPGAPLAAPVETFALLVNGVASDAAGTAIEDRIADALASYPEVPVLDPFGPQ